VLRTGNEMRNSYIMG